MGYLLPHGTAVPGGARCECHLAAGLGVKYVAKKVVSVVLFALAKDRLLVICVAGNGHVAGGQCRIPIACRGNLAWALDAAHDHAGVLWQQALPELRQQDVFFLFIVVVVVVVVGGGGGGGGLFSRGGLKSSYVWLIYKCIIEVRIIVF